VLYQAVRAVSKNRPKYPIAMLDIPFVHISSFDQFRPDLNGRILCPNLFNSRAHSAFTLLGVLHQAVRAVSKNPKKYFFLNIYLFYFYKSWSFVTWQKWAKKYTGVWYSGSHSINFMYLIFFKRINGNRGAESWRRFIKISHCRCVFMYSNLQRQPQYILNMKYYNFTTTRWCDIPLFSRSRRRVVVSPSLQNIATRL
jgi:hypothetical protein